MAETLQQEVPFILNNEIAVIISNEITMHGNLRDDSMLVIAGASWQRNRVVKHLEAKLGVLKSQLVRLNEKPRPDMITMMTSLRGNLEGQIKLLESLIGELSD